MKQNSDIRNFVEGLTAISIGGIFLCLCFILIITIAPEVTDQVISNVDNPKSALAKASVICAIQAVILKLILKKMK